MDVSSFSPGLHTLLVTATSQDGEADTADTITFTVSPPPPSNQTRQAHWTPLSRLPSLQVSAARPAQVPDALQSVASQEALSPCPPCAPSLDLTPRSAFLVSGSRAFPGLLLSPAPFLSLAFAGNASEVVLSAVDYPPGEYNLTLTVRDANGQTAAITLPSLRLTGAFAFLQCVGCSHDHLDATSLSQSQVHSL